MAFESYSELQREIIGWLGDRTELALQVPAFIALAEETIGGDLRARELHTRALAILNEEYEYVPEDFGAIDTCAIGDGTGKRKRIKWRSMAQIDAGDVADPVLTGLPSCYTIIGEQIRFAPDPGPVTIPPGVDPDMQPEKCRHFELAYWMKVRPLKIADETNLVLMHYPSVYLYGSLMQAEPYLVNDQRVELWKTLYGDAVSRANGGDKLGTVGTPAISMPEGAA